MPQRSGTFEGAYSYNSTSQMAAFQKIAEEAKKSCLISQALAAVPEIDLKARLH